MSSPAQRPLRSLLPAALAPEICHRRELLKVGAITLSAAVCGRQVHASPAGPNVGRADSVIYLWMGGGVPHIESFDPKPDAPEEIRGTIGTLRTSLPGVFFGEPMPQLAKIAHKLAVVRSFSHDSNDHLLSQVYTLSGRKVGRTQLFSEPNVGAVVSHLQGPRSGLPGYIAVPGITRPGPPPHNLFVGGWLGNEHAPFAVGGQPDQPDFTVGEKLDNPPPQCDEDLTPRVLDFPDGLTGARLARRAGLRAQLDARFRALESSSNLRAIEGQYASALELLGNTGIRRAFDLSLEAPAMRERYGRTKIGGRCLMARRLVEAGARFVMVDYGYDPDYGNLWDNHNAPSQNLPHTSKLCLRGYHLAGMDRAFAGLINDLDERGLLQKTLVVFLTEFGRTPKINSNGGRDHWGTAGSVFFTGGGVRAGQVIGATDAQAAYPITQTYSPADLAASIYAALGINLETRLLDMQNRPVPLLDHGRPIEALFT